MVWFVSRVSPGFALQLCLACGGISERADPSGAGGGGQAAGGQAGAATAPSCTLNRPAPTIALEPACANFIPALVPATVSLVEEGPFDEATQLIPYRFRAAPTAFACGMDVVIALPRLQFVSDAESYEMSMWWLGGGGLPTRIGAVALRHPDSHLVILGVASAGSLDTLNILIDPLALTFDDGSCRDPAHVDALRAGLASGGVPLACVDDSASAGDRLCRDGATQFRVAGYLGTSDSETPGVFGLSDVLQPAPR